MPTQNQIFMRQAKAALQGNWSYAALGALIYMAVLSFASISYIGQLILVGPFTVGYILYIMVICDYRRPDLNLLLKGFDSFVQTMVAGLFVSLAVGFASLFLIVPGIIVGLGFGMTFFIMIDNPGIAGVEAIQRSWDMMRGHKWELFCLTMRFFGWWILVMLTCGILSLWVAPYTTAAYLNFYRHLRGTTYSQGTPKYSGL